MEFDHFYALAAGLADPDRLVRRSTTIRACRTAHSVRCVQAVAGSWVPVRKAVGTAAGCDYDVAPSQLERAPFQLFRCAVGCDSARDYFDIYASSHGR